MIFGGLFGAYGIAGVLFERKHPTFAHAAILAGVPFGAGIMLIAQMFHIEGHPPDAVLTWALGALAAGASCAPIRRWRWPCCSSACGAAGKRPTARPSALGVPARLGRRHRPSPGSAGWRPASCGGRDGAWIISLGICCSTVTRTVRRRHRSACRRGRLSPDVDERLDGWAIPAMLRHGDRLRRTVCAAAHRNDAARLLHPAGAAGAGAGLGASASASRWDPSLLWLGYAGFSIEVLGVYFKTVGTLIGSSLFFLSAGVLVILLSIIAYRLHARVQPGMEAAP